MSRRDIVIQERDIRFLQLLLHSRVLTLKQAAVLSFGGSSEAAKKRLQKLKTSGLILERSRKAYEQSILFLSKKGFECLKEHEALPPDCADIASFSKRAQVSELTLRHELEVMDVKAAFFQASAKHGITIAEFSTWPRLYEFSVSDHHGLFGGTKIVRPDGFIRLHEQDGDGATWEHLFFLEVDRSTEKLATLVERARHYNLFYRIGGMAERFGEPAEKYKEFPFRVLVVCKSKERIKNIARALVQLNPPILTQVCFATLEDVCAEPFGGIWRFPKDYQEAAERESPLNGDDPIPQRRLLAS